MGFFSKIFKEVVSFFMGIEEQARSELGIKSAATKKAAPARKEVARPATKVEAELDTVRERQKEIMKRRRRTAATARGLGELSLKEEKLGT